MQIEHVPTLLVNKKHQKMFLVGRDAIDQYLFCKPTEQVQKEQTNKLMGRKATIPVKRKPQGQTDIRTNEPAAVIPPDDYSTQFFIQPSEEGMCPQDEKEDKQCD